MKIQPKQTDEFIRNPARGVAVALIYGPDEGLVRERAKTLGLTVVSDLNDPFNAVEIPAETVVDDPARLADEAASISMMGGRRLIRIRDGSDKMTAALKSFLADAAPSENLIVIEAGDLGPRSSLRLLCEKADNAAAVACYVEDERDLGRLLQTTAREAGFGVSRDALTLCVSNIAGDRAVARGEIEKLLLYMHNAPSKQIEAEDVIACIGNNAALSMDDAVRHAAGGNIPALSRAITALFAEGTSCIAILRAAQNYFRRLHLARSYVETGSSAEQAIGKLQPPVFFKLKPAFEAQLAVWPLADISRVLTRLCETEDLCKQTAMPDETLTSQALLAIAAQARGKNRRAA